MTLHLGTTPSPPSSPYTKRSTVKVNSISSFIPSQYEKFKPKYVVIVFVPSNEPSRFFISEQKIKRKDFFMPLNGSWSVTFNEKCLLWTSDAFQKKFRSNFFHYDMFHSTLYLQEEVATKLEQLKPNCFYLFSRSMDLICEVENTTDSLLYMNSLERKNEQLTYTFY